MTMTTEDGYPIGADHRGVVWDNHRWQRFAGRPGDIFVCTPPKCGTTWMQMIVATLLFQDGNLPAKLWDLAPWLDARFNPLDEVVANLTTQTHRRSVKTHTPAYGIPWYPDASYIVVARAGLDACMSFYNHMSNMRPDHMKALAMSAMDEGIDIGNMPALDDIHAYFAWWLESRIWFDHLSSFWARRDEPNVIFVHYDAMLADLGREMRRVAAFLTIDVPEERWPELTDRCTFASMKSRSAEISDFDEIFIGGADTFLFKGTNGRWRDVLTDEEIAAFKLRANELLPAEAIAWLSNPTSEAAA